MRSFPLIWLILAFHVISAVLEIMKVSSDCATAYHMDIGIRLQNLRRYHESLSSSKSSKFPKNGFLASTLVRKKRGDEVEEEIGSVSTRHGKHRRRRRCKNRPSCSRATTIAPETEAQRNVPFEESSNETRNMNDDLTTVEETTRRSLFNETEAINVGNFAKTEDSNASEERSVSEEADVDGLSVPTWTDTESKRDETTGELDYPDNLRSFAIYRTIDDQTTFHDGLKTLLSKLFETLRNTSATDTGNILKEFTFVNTLDEDPCQKWLNSRHKLERVFVGALATLPACPCEYPSNIFYDDKIWDSGQRKYFRWKDVSGESQRLDVYKPGAAYCVRSLLAQGSGSAAAQHCCYDRTRKLLTRGSGAGTPNFVSPEISRLLHERIDVLPWRLCKGDFSRYNGVRPPNNENGCEANPDDEEYQRQINDTKYY